MNSLLRFSSRRFLSTSIDLGSQMKKLNDNRQFKKAIDLYEHDMKKQNKQTSTLAVNQALKACIELDDIKRAKDISENLSPSMTNNHFIQTNIIRVYIKCGDYEKIKQIFVNSSNKTTVMFNNILKGLADNNRCEEALNFFKEINITPDEYTFSILLKICTHIADQRSLEFGELLFNRMPKEYHNDIVITNSALQMFIKCGDIFKAEELFNRIKNKNLFTYSIMMNGFVSNKQEQRAVDLFFQIKKPDKVILRIFFSTCAKLKTENALTLGKKVFDQLINGSNQPDDLLKIVLNMFIKCGDLKSAESLLDRIDRDVVSYGSMMKLYNIQNLPEKTLELFQRMKEENLIPNEINYVLVIDALSSIGDLSLSQSSLREMPKHLLRSLYIQNAMIHLWGKTGLPHKSKEVFDTIKHPDNVSFGAMTNTYGLNGMGIEAIEFFNKIPANKLDNVTYVCVLNACSHSGLIDQASNIFAKIPLDQRTEKVYTTMVDTYSRVFLFDEAQHFIDEYEKSNEPGIAMYMTMLSSARNAKNISLAEKIFRRMETNFSSDESSLTSARILLANTYSLSGNQSMASKVRMKINQLNMKGVIGCCWTVVNEKVYKFYAHDQSNPCSAEIYAESGRVLDQLIKHGYKPNESWVTRELDEYETTESVLCGHSERLAMMFNLIQRPRPTRIQIVKNLRICGDCHLVTKLIAKIYQCTIIVRDTSRIHHFSPNGTCSCQDHF